MNALSLHQPWASAMALGLKTIETRSWRPPERCIGERFAIASTKAEPDEQYVGGPFSDGEDVGGRYQVQPDIGVLYDCEDGWSYPLPLGCIVASGVLADAVPTHAEMFGKSRPDSWWTTGGYATPNPQRTTWVNESERAWGDFSPGRWAWLFTDLARVEDRCPWCWGEGDVPDSSLAPSEVEFTCPVCNGAGSCAPVPVKGKQRVWQWEPT